MNPLMHVLVESNHVAKVAKSNSFALEFPKRGGRWISSNSFEHTWALLLPLAIERSRQATPANHHAPILCLVLLLAIDDDRSVVAVFGCFDSLVPGNLDSRSISNNVPSCSISFQLCSVHLSRSCSNWCLFARLEMKLFGFPAKPLVGRELRSAKSAKWTCILSHLFGQFHEGLWLHQLRQSKSMSLLRSCATLNVRLNRSFPIFFMKCSKVISNCSAKASMVHGSGLESAKRTLPTSMFSFPTCSLRRSRRRWLDKV